MIRGMEKRLLRLVEARTKKKFMAYCLVRHFLKRVKAVVLQNFLVSLLEG